MEKVIQNLHQLVTHDIVRVKYPATLAMYVREAEEAWRDFIALPDEVKRSFGYKPDVLRSGVGYQGPETGRDPKEHFHVCLAEATWLKAQAVSMNHPVITKLIESALRLAEQAKPFIREDFLSTAEAEFVLPNLVQNGMNASDRWMLRFLHYFGGCKAGEIIAAEHIDKGPMTAHLYESDSGFERLTREGTWEPVTFGDSETAIIAGIGLQHRSKGRLNAVCHRVRANERTAKIGRNSIVLFIECDGIAHYDKEANGPMQGFPPGFFYDMPFEKLDSYFLH